MKYTASILIKPGYDHKIISPQEENIYKRIKSLFIIQEEPLTEELINAPQLLHKIGFALGQCGLNNLVRISHDEHDFYIDTQNRENDLKAVLDDFNLEIQTYFERHFQEIGITLEDQKDGMNYAVSVRLSRLHYPEAFPLRIKLTGVPKDAEVTEPLKRFRILTRNLEQNVKKYLAVGLIRVQYSYPQGYEEESKTLHYHNSKDSFMDMKPGSASKPSECRLFPLNGVSLGITRMSELEDIGIRAKDMNERTGKAYDYYTVGKMRFWHDGEFANSIYMTNSDPFPPQWKRIGFDWLKSYTRWRKLFKNCGFDIREVQPPINEKYRGKKSFKAEFYADRDFGPYHLRIELHFAYSQRTGINSSGTLYSMRMRGTKK